MRAEESAELMRARHEAELDQRATEVTEGLTVTEMRYLGAKILEDADDLEHGEPATSVSQAMSKERIESDE